MKKLRLLVLVMLGFTQISSTAVDCSKMSANELNEALIEAVRKDSSDEVKELVRVGADINQNITYSYDSQIILTSTLLDYAAEHGYVDTVKELIQVAKSDDINKALIVAAENRHPNVVRELIKSGADVDYVDERYGNTALINVIACSLYADTQDKNRAEVMRVLLAAGTNVNHANNNEDTALLQAIKHHDYNAVEILLKTPGINVNYADHHGNTALINALKRCLFLLDKKYIALYGKQNNNFLNSQKILEKLVQTPGINFHHVNNNGETAMSLFKQMNELLKLS